MKFHAIFSTNDIEDAGIFDDAAVIMIDVLRASTTVCAALFNGAKEIVACETTDKAINYYNNIKNKKVYLLAGEKDAVPPQGFQLGNSPYEFIPKIIKNKNIILATSNGTKIFERASEAVVKVVGAFVNVNSIVEYITSKINLGIERVVTFCAGSNGHICVEDLLCAGLFIDNISANLKQSEFSDSAKIARDFYYFNSDNIQNVIAACEHANTLRKKGFIKDVILASTLNKFDIVPIIYENSTIRLRE